MDKKKRNAPALAIERARKRNDPPSLDIVLKPAFAPHDGQAPPEGDWDVWALIAGRGFGKTMAGSQWVHSLARADGRRRFALVGATIEDVHKVMIEGTSGLMATAGAHEDMIFVPSSGKIIFASGAQAFAYSGENPEKLRGPEHDFAWCDELAKWGRPEATWHNLRLGLRRGDKPRVLVTTTPKPIQLLRRIKGAATTVTTRGRTVDNPHLPAAFVAAMTAEYHGTRIGRQEMDGEMLSEAEGSLWPRDMIEACRVKDVPKLSRIVIGVDPPCGSGAAADACGIVAVGRCEDGYAYVIGDASVTGKRPDQWANSVAAAYRRFGADKVIAEANQGGEMVETVLRAAEANLPLKLAHASKSKAARAEPVAALYQSGRMFHAGAFPELEDELTGLIAGGGYQGPSRSPDRADAMIWAAWELMLRPDVRLAIRQL